MKKFLAALVATALLFLPTVSSSAADGPAGTVVDLGAPGASRAVGDGAGGVFTPDHLGSLSGTIRRRSADGTVDGRAYGTFQYTPQYLAFDPARQVLYFHDGHAIERFDLADGRQTTILGGRTKGCPIPGPCGDGGPASDATLTAIRGLDVGPDGSLYIGDYGRVRRITPDGTINQVPGAADLDYFTAMAVDADGSVVVSANATIVRIRAGQRSGITQDAPWCSIPDPCGRNGTPSTTRLGDPVAIDIAADGTIYVAENHNAVVSAFTPDGRSIHVAGGWAQCHAKPTEPGCDLGRTAPLTRLNPIVSMTVSGNDLFVVDLDPRTGTSRLLRIPGVASVPYVQLQRYRFLAGDGGVFNFGWAPFHGSTGDRRLNQPIVGGAAHGAGGYYLVARDGGIFSFGDAPFHGSAVGRTTSPVVGMAALPGGVGYLVLERNGRVHAFGQATHAGNATVTPAVGIVLAGTAGPGYYVSAADGRMQLLTPGAPRRDVAPRRSATIVGLAGTLTGGVWQVASNGSVFSTGEVEFFGSMGGRRLNQPIVGIIATDNGAGYWLIAADGGVFSFGEARFMGSTGHLRLNKPIVGVMSAVMG